MAASTEIPRPQTVTEANFPEFDEKEYHKVGEQYDLYMSHACVSYTKGKQVLTDVCLYGKPGEIIGLIGGSGAGKSTALRVCTSQVHPTKGFAVTAGCHTIKDRGKMVYKIGYVPQLEYLSLYYEFNSLENCLFFGRNYQIPREEIFRRGREIMHVLGFENETLIKRPVKYLSGGEKKRVSIAVGLINTPQVLFLDEPTTGLDPHLRIETLNFLLKINREFKTTMVIVSHDLEVADYCSKVAILNFGHLAGFGKPKELVESLPSHGKILLAKFENLNNLEDIPKILKIPGVKYALNAGRNKIKIFADNMDNIAYLTEQIQKTGLSLKSFTVDSGVFLDYFRIRGRHIEGV